MSEEMAIEVVFARDLMKDFLNPDGTVNNEKLVRLVNLTRTKLREENYELPIVHFHDGPSLEKGQYAIYANGELLRQNTKEVDGKTIDAIANDLYELFRK